jgi:hypothetical protein
VPPALNYRLQGHNYAAIGKHLGVTANAVQKDVVKALRDFIKPETEHAVLAMELTRLDAMQAAVYAEAINGDTGAIDTCLKIMNQRQRLLNLVPDHKPPVFNLSFGGGTDMPNAGLRRVTTERGRRPRPTRLSMASCLRVIPKGSPTAPV